MGEPVGPAEVDEDAEIGDGGDAALVDFALAQLVDDALLLLAPPFRHGGPLGEDGAVLAAVDLDHLEAHFAAHERGQGGGGVGIVAADAVHLGEGDEGVDALHVGQHAAAVVADDFGGEGFPRFEARGQDLPALLAAGAVERDDAVALGAHGLEHHHAHAVPRLQAGLSVHAQREHLVLGDDGLGLGAHVHDDAVGGSAHDGAGDDLAAAQAARLGRLRFQQRGHVHFGGLGRRAGRDGGLNRIGRGRRGRGDGFGGRGDGGGRFVGGGPGGLFVDGHWWAPFDSVARLS